MSNMSSLSDYRLIGCTAALVALIRAFKSRRKDTGMRHGPRPTRHAPGTTPSRHQRSTVRGELPSSRATYETLTNRSLVVIVFPVYNNEPVLFVELRLDMLFVCARESPRINVHPFATKL